MQAGNFFGVSGATGSAFDPTTGILLGTHRSRSLEASRIFPRVNRAGMGCGMSRPGECIGQHAVKPAPTAGPTTYIFNGSSPNTATWYTGKVDYDHLLQTKTLVQFQLFPDHDVLCPSGSPVPQRRDGV